MSAMPIGQSGGGAIGQIFLQPTNLVSQVSASLSDMFLDEKEIICTAKENMRLTLSSYVNHCIVF